MVAEIHDRDRCLEREQRDTVFGTERRDELLGTHAFGAGEIHVTVKVLHLISCVVLCCFAMQYNKQNPLTRACTCT